MKRIAIVGAGFSGTALAALLHRRAAESVDITLFERTGIPGAGLAYGTTEPVHLLNVPATQMSAFADEPDHFIRWCESNQVPVGDGFVPRTTYRQYLQSLLPSEVSVITEDVLDVTPNGTLTTRNGKSRADFVILATGYSPQTRLGPSSATLADHLDWSSLPLRPKVLILGSGLTAVDVICSASVHRPQAQILCISRRGQLPHPMEAATPWTVDPFPAEKTIRSLCKWVRAEVHRAHGNGHSSQSVFNALRPNWETLWQELPESERARFLRHLRPYFDRFRHRISPGPTAIINQFVASGQLTVIKGSIRHVAPKTVQVRIGGHDHDFSADLIVDATGRVPSRLPSSLRGHERYLDSEFRITTNVYAIGPILRGPLWETTAVPDLRRQIAVVAQSLLSS